MIEREKLEEEIRQVAYELYLRSGCAPGRDLDNWLEAEKIVLAKYQMKSQEETPEILSQEKPKRKRICKKGEGSKGSCKGKGKKI